MTLEIVLVYVVVASMPAIPMLGRRRYDLVALLGLLLLAVAIGGSCAFLTPIGHQSNVLVLEPGGYKFGDYWRLGLPIEIIIILVGVPMILWLFPF